MSKSVIDVINTNQGIAIADGGVYAPTTIDRRYGTSIQLNNNGITLADTGYYNVHADISVIASGAGVLTATLYANGVAIPGATASVTTIASDVYTLNINKIVRVTCPCNSKIITVVLSGIAATSYNLDVAAEKL